MKHLFYKFLGLADSKNRNIVFHIFWSFVYKFGSVVCGFLLVPVALDFLDIEAYGLWLTLSSFIGWFSILDIGFGNGLRNKIIETSSTPKKELVKGYVSTAYVSVGILCIVSQLIFITLNHFIDWSKFFNVSASYSQELSFLMPLIFGFFSFHFLVKLVFSIYIADMNQSFQGKIIFITQLAVLICIWFFVKINLGGIFLFAFINVFIPFIILLIINISAFKKKYLNYSPTFKYFNKDLFYEISNLSLKFFLIQISGIVIFSTDSFMISRFFNVKEVVPFQVAFKYFNITVIIFSIISTSFLTAISKSHSLGDFKWIKSSMYTLVKISIFLSSISLIQLLIANKAYSIWTHEKIDVPVQVSVYMMVYQVILILITPFTIYLNATGKIFIQTVQSIFSAVLNIPLSYYFAMVLEMGVAGVIIGSICSVLFSLLLSPVQYFLLINGSRNKILNS